MEKIYFNDSLYMTDAVIRGEKTQIRELIEFPSLLKHLPFRKYGLKKDDAKEDTYLIVDEETGQKVINCPCIRPRYKVGDIMVIAQRYKDFIDTTHPEYVGLIEGKKPWELPGWGNKKHAKTEYLPHRVQITDVRTERIKDVREGEWFQEGIIENEKHQYEFTKYKTTYSYSTPKDAFSSLMMRLFGEDTVFNNQYVFVYTFKLIQ